MKIINKSLIHDLMINLLACNNNTLDKAQLFEIASKTDNLLSALFDTVERNLEHGEVDEIVKITTLAMDLVKMNKQLRESYKGMDDDY